jgi:hypothetical protein
MTLTDILGSPEDSFTSQEDWETQEERSFLSEAKELFKLFQRMLEAMVSYGDTHPHSTQRIDDTFAKLTEVTTLFNPFRWRVRPYAFESFQRPFWEPDEPFDAIPYNLFSSGVRSIRITKEITKRHFIHFARLLLYDPLKDFAAEDDIVTALWDLQLEGIEIKLVTSFPFDDPEEQTSFQNAFDASVPEVRNEIASQVQQEILRLRMLKEVGEEAMAEAEARFTRRSASMDSSLQIEAIPQKRLNRLIRAHREQVDHWENREAIVFAEILNDAFLARDSDSIVTAFSDMVSTYLRPGRAREFLTFWSSVASLLVQPTASQTLIRTSFDEKKLTWLILKLGLDQSPQRIFLTDEELNSLDSIFTALDSTLFEWTLSLLDEHWDALKLLQPLLLSYLGRSVTENLDIYAAKILATEGEFAIALIELSDSDNVPIAIQRKAIEHTDPMVRVRAVEIVARRDISGLKDPIISLLRDARASIRRRSLQVAVQFGVREVVRELIAFMNTNDFYKRPLEEQNLFLHMLYELSPNGAQKAAINLVRKHHMIQGISLDEGRLAAAQFLGATSTSSQAITALESATKLRPWNSAELRDASKAAVDLIRGRLSDGDSQ